MRPDATPPYVLTLADRQQLLARMHQFAADIADPVGSRFPVVAAALVDISDAERRAGRDDIYVARNHETLPPHAVAHHAEELLWAKLQDGGVAPERVRAVAVSSPRLAGPLFPCGGCREYTSSWPHAVFFAPPWHAAGPGLAAALALPARDLYPWHFARPGMQAAAAQRATRLPPDHAAQGLIALAVGHLGRSQVRGDRGVLQMAVAVTTARVAGGVVGCMLQISGRLVHAGAAACAAGIAAGAGPLTAAAVVGTRGDGRGLFVPPLGGDLDFLAASASDRSGLPVYIHDSVSGQTLSRTLGELLPSDPDLWGSGRRQQPSLQAELAENVAV